MIKIKTKDFLRNTILFGIAILLGVFANVISLFGGNSFNTAVDIMFWAIIMLNIAIFSSILSNIRRDFALFIFAVSFNILLLGRVYVTWFGHHDKLLLLLEAENFSKLFQALQLVGVSLLFVFAAYKLGGIFWRQREEKCLNPTVSSVSRNPILPILRKLSEIVLYISSVPFLYILFQSAIAVVRGGYLNSFTNTTQIPSIVSRMSMFFVPAFAVFLATIPTRKQMKWPLMVYGIYMLSSLFTGRRNTLVCEALMLMIYFVMRDNLLSKDKRILKKSTVLYTGFFGIIAMYLLQLVAFVRAGITDKPRGLFATLISFLNSQGASFRVIMQTVNNINLFNPATSYVYLFYPFEMFVHNNVITRTLFGLKPIIEVQTPEFVSTTHNFAHVLTYLVDPKRYLEGGGFGTSYVAESYVSFGIIGLIVVSIFIGLIFRFFSSLLTRSWVVITCGLLAIKSFVYIPRDFALLWVTEVFNITYICFFVAIYLAALFIAKGTHVIYNKEVHKHVVLEEQV
jgi:oligosaccharide repeat unit polymerase